jgi:post-segregation antitoxin (ccd killing protein)
VKDTWPRSVREPPYAPDAPRQTVSLTINSDLFARVKSLGINASRVAEEALARELERLRREQVEAEVRGEVAAINEYERAHGSFSARLRRHRGVKLEGGD